MFDFLLSLLSCYSKSVPLHFPEEISFFFLIFFILFYYTQVANFGSAEDDGSFWSRWIKPEAVAEAEV